MATTWKNKITLDIRHLCFLSYSLITIHIISNIPNHVDQWQHVAWNWEYPFLSQYSFNHHFTSFVSRDLRESENAVVRLLIHLLIKLIKSLVLSVGFSAKGGIKLFFFFYQFSSHNYEEYYTYIPLCYVDIKLYKISMCFKILVIIFLN